jgi:hypothetical protein
MAPRKALRIYLERGDKRTFACALDWPGWCRSGRTDEDAVEALLAYGKRYARVARRAKVPFEAPEDGAAVDIVDRLKGGGGTDFGVPGAIPKADGAPVNSAELKRQSALLTASWAAFDSAARSARGRQLRKGPRGGGRDLAKMTGHVLEAEVAYLSLLGSRRPKGGKAADQMSMVRAAVLGTLDAVVSGTPVADPSNTKRRWQPRYFVRRAAWHVLDHAWEIEDRVT